MVEILRLAQNDSCLIRGVAQTCAENTVIQRGDFKEDVTSQKPQSFKRRNSALQKRRDGKNRAVQLPQKRKKTGMAFIRAARWNELFVHLA